MSEEKKGFTLSKTQVIISIICGLLIIIGTLGGLFIKYDNSLVHMGEYKAFKQQVNEQTLHQRIEFYQRIVWDLETLHKTSDPLKMGDDTEKYRTASKNLDAATKQLEAIQEGKDK
jgi:hypothetical protein